MPQMTRLPEWHSTWWWEPLNYSYIIGKYEHAQKIYRTQRNLILSISTLFKCELSLLQASRWPKLPYRVHVFMKKNGKTKQNQQPLHL